jgi:hypothetical protein
MSLKPITVYLDEHHAHPITISADAFADVERLVLAARVCGVCALAYSSERIRVAANTCLLCYVQQQRDTYTFAGRLETEEPSKYETFLFLDVNGIVHLSTTGNDYPPQESKEQTLRYYGFPVPTTYPEADEQKTLYSGEWNFCGDVRQHAALVIEYIKRSGDHQHIPFLVYKHGPVMFLDKRRGETRRLYQAAKKQYEAVTPQHSRWTSGIYKLVSALASAEYKAPEG